MLKEKTSITALFRFFCRQATLPLNAKGTASLVNADSLWDDNSKNNQMLAALHCNLQNSEVNLFISILKFKCEQYWRCPVTFNSKCFFSSKRKTRLSVLPSGPKEKEKKVKTLLHLWSRKRYFEFLRVSHVRVVSYTLCVVWGVLFPCMVTCVCVGELRVEVLIWRLRRRKLLLQTESWHQLLKEDACSITVPAETAHDVIGWMTWERRGGTGRVKWWKREAENVVRNKQKKSTWRHFLQRFYIKTPWKENITFSYFARRHWEL